MAIGPLFKLVSYVDPVYNSALSMYEWSMTVENTGSTALSGSTEIFTHFKGLFDISSYHNGSPKLSLSSSKATSITETALSAHGYDMLFSEDISSGEEVTIDVQLVEVYGVLIHERFLFQGQDAADAMFSHFGSVCGISEGLDSNSAAVKIVGDFPSGTDFFLYRSSKYSIQNPIGMATVSDSTPGYAWITPTESIIVGESYIAYATTKGFATYGASIATESLLDNSGWKEPVSLFDENDDETAYAAYLLAGGTPIAANYDPKNTINRATKSEPCVIDFDLAPRFDLQIVRDGNDYIVTVVNASSYLGNIRLSWDSGSEVSDREQTFSPSGVENHTVKILHETDDNISAERTFTIDDAINSYTSDLWAISYEPNVNDNKQVSIIAYGTEAIDARIDEIDGAGVWHAMTLVDASTHKYQLSGEYYNVTAGTKTIQIKRNSQPTYEIEMLLKLDW